MAGPEPGADLLQPPAQDQVVVLPPAVEGEIAGGLAGVVGKGPHQHGLGPGTEGVELFCRLRAQKRLEAAQRGGTPCRRASGLPELIHGTCAPINFDVSWRPGLP